MKTLTLTCTFLATQTYGLPPNLEEHRFAPPTFEVESDWPEQFYIGEKKGGIIAQKMREWATAQGKEWPAEFYEGELKGGKFAAKMRAWVKAQGKDWPAAFYEGELKGGERETEMKGEMQFARFISAFMPMETSQENNDKEDARKEVELELIKDAKIYSREYAAKERARRSLAFKKKWCSTC